MKSAYELAMERLAKSDPSATTPLTPEKKSRLAEIDRVPDLPESFDPLEWDKRGLPR